MKDSCLSGPMGAGAAQARQCGQEAVAVPPWGTLGVGLVSRMTHGAAPHAHTHDSRDSPYLLGKAPGVKCLVNGIEEPSAPRASNPVHSRDDFWVIPLPTGHRCPGQAFGSVAPH